MLRSFIITLGTILSLTNFSLGTESRGQSSQTDPVSKAVPGTETSDEDKADESAAPAKPDVAAEKFWQALKLLDSKIPAEVAEGRAILQTSADLEFAHAQTLLAECLMTGQYGFPKDQRKAANCYRLAAERGNAYAMVSIGQCFYSGTGVRKDHTKATEWLTAALDEKADYDRPIPPPKYLADIAQKSGNTNTVAGDIARDSVGDCKAAANYLLGLIDTDNKKPEHAHKHFVAAALAGLDGRSGIYPAAVQAALNYAFGQGTPRDMVKANEMLAISRKLTVGAGVRMIHNYAALKVVDDFATGDMEDEIENAGEQYQTQTQFEIASAFTDKKSRDYNPGEAAKWFELAAQNGSAWAMLNLAFLYSGNELGQPDPAKAFAWFERVGGGEKPKHSLGTANLAICLQNGIGTPKDTLKAAELFKKHKDSEFICYLGTIGQCPVKIVSWDERFKLIETWAKKKNPQALYTLGQRYSEGWDGKVDLSAAVRWLKKAAAANHGHAWTRLGILHEFNREFFSEDVADSQASALDCYKHATELGDPDGMANYANFLNNGMGINRDPEKAEQIYLKCLAIKPSHARAHNNLASIYEKRVDTTARESSEMLLASLPTTSHLREIILAKIARMEPVLSEAAREDLMNKMLFHYEESFRLEYAYAASNLSRLYRNGVLVDRDYHKAYMYSEKAVEWGMPQEHYWLGEMHRVGLGVPITYSEAAYHYRLAALEGHIPSYKKLSTLYLSGKLGEIDLDRALFWLLRLGEFDSDAIATAIDVLLQKKSYKQAIELLRLLEQQGSPRQVGFACERLSRCYESGLGVKLNLSKAKKYFQRALDAENSDAIARRGLQRLDAGKIKEAIDDFQYAALSSGEASFQLGKLYFFGTQVEKNQALALDLMRKAAAKNHPAALCFLADATLNQIPGAPSLDKAIIMATQAEAAGYEKAKTLREKLEKRRDKKNDDTPEEAARARSS